MKRLIILVMTVLLCNLPVSLHATATTVSETGKSSLTPNPGTSISHPSPPFHKSLPRLLELEKKKQKETGELKLRPGDYIPGEILIKLRVKPDLLKEFRWKQSPDNPESVDEFIQKLGVLKQEPLFRKHHRFTIPESARLKADQIMNFDSRLYQRLQFPETKSLKAIIEALQKHPLIEYTEPNYIRNPIGNAPPVDRSSKTDPIARNSMSSDVARHSLPGNVSGNALQSHPDLRDELSGNALRSHPDLQAASALPSTATDSYYQQQWHLGAVNAPQAWQFLADNGVNPGGSSDVVIAIIDTGVDYTHPDLAGNMWINTGEIPGNGADDDGNGFVDDVYGANVVSNDMYHSGDPQDDHGHGTHVAGIACAQGNNGIGGVGVAYNSRIMAIKAAHYSGVLTTTDISEGILYAVDKGADVINMSFGGYSKSQVEEDALAVGFGQTVLVAAAGE